MRENRICMRSPVRLPATSNTMLLNELQNGAHAIVTRVLPSSTEVDSAALRRLAELGFIAGEPVQLLRRGPGGREPLAVRIGNTMFGLRLLEAQCIEVEVGTDPAAEPTAAASTEGKTEAKAQATAQGAAAEAA